MTRFFRIRWFFLRAMEFEKAYHAVPPPPPFSWSWPRYFLLCHAIELALKAFLTLHGASEPDLKKIGHDLKKLLKHAEKFGLKLTPDTQHAIERLARAHKEHWARYPREDDGEAVVYAIEQFEKNAAELLQKVRVAIYPPPPNN
jgi:hypothetical protein